MLHLHSVHRAYRVRAREARWAWAAVLRHFAARDGSIRHWTGRSAPRPENDGGDSGTQLAEPALFLG